MTFQLSSYLYWQPLRRCWASTFKGVFLLSLSVCVPYEAAMSLPREILIYRLPSTLTFSRSLTLSHYITAVMSLWEVHCFARDKKTLFYWPATFTSAASVFTFRLASHTGGGQSFRVKWVGVASTSAIGCESLKTKNAALYSFFSSLFSHISICSSNLKRCALICSPVARKPSLSSSRYQPCSTVICCYTDPSYVISISDVASKKWNI